MEPRVYVVCCFAVLLVFFDFNNATEKTGECPFKSQQRGHMKPFGHHARRWLRVESRYDEITAEEFYSKYVRPSKPVVIRGGIADWPAVQKWPNLTYLGERTHDTLMNADWRKIYDEHEYVASHAVRRMITMKDFIKRMNSENIYMDSPPTAPLLEDMMWPQLTNCEYFINRMRAPSFFFNNGKSNTDIHIDGCETLFFQVSGIRLWLMTPPDNAQYMYSGQEYFPPHMGISAVNQHKVNLTEFPKMAHSVLHAAVVYPGDLVYVPEAWFHNVMAKGNPNMATTIFFDSSNCEKVFAESNDAEFVQACHEHRKVFLPQSIECKKKLPKGTTWMDVSRLYGKTNKKLLPSQGHGTLESHLKLMKRLKPLEHKVLRDKSKLPRMILDADMTPFIESRPDKSLSILQTRFRFFYPRLNDIAPLAEHLHKFKIERSEVSFMLAIPHEVSAGGADVTKHWLNDAMTRFAPYPIGSVDVVLLEAPPCVPASKEAQDCDRNEAMSEQRLAVWHMLEDELKRGTIRHLGVKDVSSGELETLLKEAKERISLACLRFDPLYRQIKLRKALKKAKVSVIVHSTSGSGWKRDGVMDKNPLFDQQQVLNNIFGQTGSFYTRIYEWVLRKGYFVIPERTGKAPVAEISYDAIVELRSGVEQGSAVELMDDLVLDDDIGKLKRKKTRRQKDD